MRLFYCELHSYSSFPTFLLVPHQKIRNRSDQEETIKQKNIYQNFYWFFFNCQYLTEELAKRECLIHRTRNSRDNLKVRVITLTLFRHTQVHSGVYRYVKRKYKLSCSVYCRYPVRSSIYNVADTHAVIKGLRALCLVLPWKSWNFEAELSFLKISMFLTLKNSWKFKANKINK